MPEGVPKKVFFFPVGKQDICHYSVEKVPCVSIAESWVTQRYHAKIKTVTRVRATRGGGFVVRRFRNYNRCKEGYRRTSVACQIDAFQEKTYTKEGDSSQAKKEWTVLINLMGDFKRRCGNQYRVI